MAGAPQGPRQRASPPSLNGSRSGGGSPASSMHSSSPRQLPAQAPASIRWRDRGESWTLGGQPNARAHDLTGDVDMWRWTMRIFVVLGAFLTVAAFSGATYQWLATRKELAATPPPGHLVDIGGY